MIGSLDRQRARGQILPVPDHFGQGVLAREGRFTVRLLGWGHEQERARPRPAIPRHLPTGIAGHRHARQFALDQHALRICRRHELNRGGSGRQVGQGKALRLPFPFANELLPPDLQRERPVGHDSQPALASDRKLHGRPRLPALAAVASMEGRDVVPTHELAPPAGTVPTCTPLGVQRIEDLHLPPVSIVAIGLRPAARVIAVAFPTDPRRGQGQHDGVHPILPGMIQGRPNRLEAPASSQRLHQPGSRLGNRLRSPAIRGIEDHEYALPTVQLQREGGEAILRGEVRDRLDRAVLGVP